MLSLEAVQEFGLQQEISNAIVTTSRKLKRIQVVKRQLLTLHEFVNNPAYVQKTDVNDNDKQLLFLFKKYGIQNNWQLRSQFGSNEYNKR